MDDNIVDVDKIWKALGQLGRFQMKQLIITLVSIWSCGFHVLSIVFIGYRPDYTCNEEPPSNESLYNESSLTWRTYESCKIKTHTNNSGVVTTTETSCIYGYNYSVAKDTSFVTEWDLVCDRSSYAELSQTLIMLGQAVGAFVFTSLSDRFGRKPVNIGCHVTLFVVALATAFMPNFIEFAAFRLITGTFQQGIGLTLAIINLELFPKEIRGYMEVMGLVFWTTGIALITPLGYIFKDVSWRYLQITLACLSAWSLTHWWLLDESLRWLIANGKVEKAKALIQKACHINKKNYNEVVTVSGFRDWEIAMKHGKHEHMPLSESAQNGSYELQGSAKIYNSEGVVTNGTKIDDSLVPVKPKRVKKYTVIDLVKSRRLFLTSLIMWFAWITNSLTYYGIMLISSTLAGNRFLNFFLGSIVEYPAAFLEYVSINRFGRKPTMIYFHCICGVALITATIFTTASGGSGALVICSTVFTLIGKMAITGSFSTIFLYTPELYPTNMRNVGIGMSSTAARAGAMLAPFSRNLAEAVEWAPGLVYGIMCAIVASLAIWIPETNKYELPQTIEECEVWYKDNRLRLPCTKRRHDHEQTEDLQRGTS